MVAWCSMAGITGGSHVKHKLHMLQNLNCEIILLGIREWIPKFWTNKKKSGKTVPVTGRGGP
jgi:hypothetical protein